MVIDRGRLARWGILASDAPSLLILVVLAATACTLSGCAASAKEKSALAPSNDTCSVSGYGACASGGSSLQTDGGGDQSARKKLHSFFGEPAERDDEWLRHAVELASSGNLLGNQRRALMDAIQILRYPLTSHIVGTARDKLSAAIGPDGSPRILSDMERRLLVQYPRYWPGNLTSEIGSTLDTYNWSPDCADLKARFLLLQDGKKTSQAQKLFVEAASVRPQDQRKALLAGLALASSGKTAEALRMLEKHASESSVPDLETHALILAAFAYLKATDDANTPEKMSEVQKTLNAAIKLTGTSGSGIAAVFQASMAGQVPFDVCSRLFYLLRDLVLQPHVCEQRLELGLLLNGFSSVPAAVTAGSALLTQFPFVCSDTASSLSGMGQHWIDAPDHRRGSMGLGRDLKALAHIRRGLRNAQYAHWDMEAKQREAEYKGDASRTTPSQEMPKDRTSRMVLEEVLHIAELVNTSAFRGSTVAKPQRCSKQKSAQVDKPKPFLARPPVKDPLGCPKVKPQGFAKHCLKARRPCVLRQQHADFLRKRPGIEHELDRWVDIAGDSAVKVSFPFPPKKPNEYPTLNDIQDTQKFFKRPDVQSTLKLADKQPPNSTRLPWTLVRPSVLHMRFRDLASWARSGSPEAYMNQIMVADLGSDGIAELAEPAWVSASGLQLLNPSLWLATGTVATGYHWDAPDNLLVQLSGDKEVLLLHPSEVRNLKYDEVYDVDPGPATATLGSEVGPLSVESSGLSAWDRTSKTHSVIDIASSDSLQQHPVYSNASGMVCRIQEGDVLWIPAFWHHAVVTTPDETCVGLSLNLWYMHPDKPKTFEEAAASKRAATS